MDGLKTLGKTTFLAVFYTNFFSISYLSEASKSSTSS